MLSPQDRDHVRQLLAEIDAQVAEHRAALAQLAHTRASLAATLRAHTGMSLDQLGALLGVSGARAGELARAGRVMDGIR